jgi:hypothetical protein
MLKCWADIPGYKSFFCSKWRSFQVEGWGGYIMKEKLRLIKEALKEWHTHNLSGKITNAKHRIAELDEKGETYLLGEEEVEELHDLFEDLHPMFHIQSNICWQRSQLMWLREGDANSKKKSWHFG